MVKECLSCQLAAKASLIRIQSWSKTDITWTRSPIDYARPLNGHYELIIMDSFSKWPGIFKCRHPTSINTVNVLNELFSRFGESKTLVSDNGTQFTGRKFKNFCTSLYIDHITTFVFHPILNGQKRFVDTFKRTLRKNQGMNTGERNIQKFFLAVYRIIPNPNLDSGLSSAELKFARKIRSVFDWLFVT